MHRDLKPENLIFENADERAELKLIDLGLAVRLGGDKELQDPVGTPDYVAVWPRPSLARLPPLPAISFVHCAIALLVSALTPALISPRC